MRKNFLVKQKYLLILKIKNKMKNLQEMSLNEMRKTEGGWAGLIMCGGILLLAAAVHYYCREEEEEKKKQQQQHH